MKYDNSWVTNPKWQFIVGSFIAICILFAGLVPLLAVQSERDQRQDDFAVESIARDKEIKAESIRITCGILQGFDRLTPQVEITGQEDSDTLQRLLKVNSDRSAARKIIRESMPADIVSECSSTP